MKPPRQARDQLLGTHECVPEHLFIERPGYGGTPRNGVDGGCRQLWPQQTSSGLMVKVIKAKQLVTYGRQSFHLSSYLFSWSRIASCLRPHGEVLPPESEGKPRKSSTNGTEANKVWTPYSTPPVGVNILRIILEAVAIKG